MVQTNYGNAWSVDVNGGRMVHQAATSRSTARTATCGWMPAAVALGGPPPLSVAGFTEDDIGVLLSTASTAGPGRQHPGPGPQHPLDQRRRFEVVALDSSGAGKAGTINVHAIGADGPESSGVLALEQHRRLVASASTPTGDGGSIVAKGDNSIKAHGVFEAKGGASGGNGGLIETSGGAFNVPGSRSTPRRRRARQARG